MRAAIHKEIDRLKTEDVTDEELAMFKTRSRADLLRGLDDNQGIATSLALYQTRFGDWHQLFRELDEDDKVTKADIRHASPIESSPTAIAPAPLSRPRRHLPRQAQEVPE